MKTTQEQTESAKHTPGPWQKSTGYLVTAKQGNSYVIVHYAEAVNTVLSRAELEANAELIASAPQLSEENAALKATNKELAEKWKYAIEAMKDLLRQIPNDENLADYNLTLCEIAEQQWIDFEKSALRKAKEQ